MNCVMYRIKMFHVYQKGKYTGMCVGVDVSLKSSVGKSSFGKSSLIKCRLVISSFSMVDTV